MRVAHTSPTSANKSGVRRIIGRDIEIPYVRCYCDSPAVRRLAIWLTMQVIACPTPPARFGPMRLGQTPQVDFLGTWQHEGLAWLTDRSQSWPIEYRARCWAPFLPSSAIKPVPSIKGRRATNQGADSKNGHNEGKVADAWGDDFTPPPHPRSTPRIKKKSQFHSRAWRSGGLLSGLDQMLADFRNLLSLLHQCPSATPCLRGIVGVSHLASLLNNHAFDVQFW